jgi:hypothetical protein
MSEEQNIQQPLKLSVKIHLTEVSVSSFEGKSLS